MSLRTIRNSLPLWCFKWKKVEYEPVAWHEYFRDDFDDGVIGYEWMTHGLSADKTVKEADDLLTISSLNNVESGWWCDIEHQNKCPKIYMPLQIEGPCRITTKLNEYVINDDTLAGIFIGIDPEGWGPYPGLLAYLWGRSEGANFAWLQSNCGSGDIMTIGGGAPFFPTWLQIRIDADNKITFWLSTDGSTWQQYTDTTSHAWTEISGYDIANSYVGLFAKNITIWYENVAAPFEYFLIEVEEARRATESECYAPIDVRTPDTFYEGRIQSMATLKRSIDDKTGLFQIADMSLTLKNTDKHFSDLLARRILEDQEAILSHGWTDEAASEISHMITMIVEDYSLKGTDFIVKLKDISQKYFTQQVPTQACTEDDYEHISDGHKGRYKPEVLGYATLPDGYEHKGAVEAVYVDTVAGRYIAANRPLRDITEVFVDDTLRNEGAGALDYSWEIADGDTYIDFVTAPGTDEVVSFNAQGYFRDAWNDPTNGYIQNPAYGILFYLRFIMNVPGSLIDIPSFNTLADYYTSIGEEQSFYLILQYREDAMEIVRQMLFTAGAKLWITMAGKFTIAQKDINDWEIASADYHFLEQTDLIGPPHRKWNLLDAINTVNVQYGYIPWQDLYAGARSEYRKNQYVRPKEGEIRDRRRRK